MYCFPLFRGHVSPESLQASGLGIGNGTGTPAIMPWTTAVAPGVSSSNTKIQVMQLKQHFCNLVSRLVAYYLDTRYIGRLLLILNSWKLTDILSAWYYCKIFSQHVACDLWTSSSVIHHYNQCHQTGATERLTYLSEENCPKKWKYS